MRDPSPLVTITIPTYNRADLLRDVIESVLAQSLGDFELFVSDNASSDRTADVVAGFDDPRIRYVRNETNIGPLRNLSRGFELGGAPYVCILQDDDLMLPENLKRKVEGLEGHPDVDWVHSSFRRISVWPDGTETVEESVNWVHADRDVTESGRSVVHRLLVGSYFIPYSASLFRRWVVERERFDEADGPAADLGLALRVAHRARAVTVIADPLFVGRFHTESDSAKQRIIERGDSAYRASFAGLGYITRAKERFLSQHGHEIDDVEKIRMISRRWLHEQLLYWVKKKKKSRQGRSLFAVGHALREAAAVDPMILVNPMTARLLVSSAIGPQGRAILRAVRSGTSVDRPR